MPKYYDPVPEYILNDDEKKRIVDCWNGGARDMRDLVIAAVGEGFDGRSAQGKAVKKYLAAQNLEARPAQTYIKKKEQEIILKDTASPLTDNQKEFVANNHKDMDVLDMTRAIFKNDNLTTNDREYKDVRDFTFKLKGVSESGGELADYKPPKTEKQILEKIRQCATIEIKEEGLNPKFMEGVARLIRFLDSFKFCFEMNNLRKQSERDLFESSFIKYTYSKPDLTEEEVDSYIDVCSEIISHERMKQEEIILAESARLQAIDDKIQMGIVESLGKLRTTMDQNKKRRDKALEGLNGLRADRLDKIETGQATIANLIQEFRLADKRNKMLDELKNKRDGLAAEINRLTGMDALYAEFFGVSQKEITL